MAMWPANWACWSEAEKRAFQSLMNCMTRLRGAGAGGELDTNGGEEAASGEDTPSQVGQEGFGKVVNAIKSGSGGRNDVEHSFLEDLSGHVDGG